MSKTFIGIDPPLNVATSDVTMEDVQLDKFSNLGELIDHLQQLVDESPDCESVVVVCEDVPCFIKEIPASRSFKQGKAFGEVIGAVRALGIPLHFLRPQAWQKGFGGLKGLTGYPRKKALADHAKRLFPNTKITVPVADSLLILRHFLLTNQTNN